MRDPLIFLLFLSAFIFHMDGEAQSSSAQKAGLNTNLSFIDYQKTFPRLNEAMKRKEDTLRKQFEAKNLKWPAKYIYIRSFKYDSELEIWVKDEVKEPFKLFDTYKVCALAGALGPKRMEGDYQVPEGFYMISEFNPKSSYHLSLGLNYPNVSDRILSDVSRPGGEIYIHGSCVTVGCIPMTDGKMEDIYIISAFARSSGQDFIPVHIFPIRFNVQRSADFLDNFSKDDPDLRNFALKLEDAFYYFEKNKQLPIILINEQGAYFVEGALPPKKNLISVKEEKVVPKIPVSHRFRNVGVLAESVHQWPQFPGGSKAFTQYLEKLGNDMAAYLPKGKQKVFVKMEFIIDRDGVPVNFKIDRSISHDFDDELISRMEKMGTWKPALLHDKPVAKMMVQTILIEAF